MEMKKSYKVAAVVLALVLMFSVMTMTGFAKFSFSSEVDKVATVVGAQKCFKFDFGTDCDFGTDTDFGTYTDFGTDTDFGTATDVTTKTDCGSIFSRIFAKIIAFFRSIFSMIGLS